MQLVLTVVSGPDPSLSGHSFQPDQSGRTLIGRSTACDIVLADNSKVVSSRHCIITHAAGLWRVEDISRNGTLLDGAALTAGKPVPLQSGAKLEIGPWCLVADLSDSKAQAGETARISPAPAQNAMDVIGLFATAADLSPDDLSGYTARDLITDSGAVASVLARHMRTSASLMQAQRKLAGSSATAFGHGGDDDLAASLNEKQFLRMLLAERGGLSQTAEGHLAEFAAHQAAFAQAMQEALFRLLNMLSPMEVEKGARGAFGGAKSRWNAYEAIWDGLSSKGENGIYDVYIEFFREAYERALTETV